MPCIFCIAVVTAVVAQAGAGIADLLADRLRTVTADPVERTADTGSVARLETAVPLDGRSVPVALTLYKAHGRVRIQVLSHELSRDDAEKLQNLVAEACGLQIVERSSPEGEQVVRSAMTPRPEAEAAQQQRPSNNPLRQPRPGA
jgi:septal ring factor EnvC (AmiA/AmiB activator)